MRLAKTGAYLADAPLCINLKAFSTLQSTQMFKWIERTHAKSVVFDGLAISYSKMTFDTMYANKKIILTIYNSLCMYAELPSQNR